MENKNSAKKSFATSGHCYAFGLYRSGWYNMGMVADNKRDWWADFWRSNKSESGGHTQGQCAARVAFVPFCFEGSNFISSACQECEAVETIPPVHTETNY